MKIYLSAVLMLLGVICSYAKSETSDSVGLKFALLGDSMTWIGGDSCQNPTGWSHILRESGIADKIDVYARSGATWTNTSSTLRNPSHYSEVLHDDNVVYNQAIRLIENAKNPNEDPDIIVLFAGANDAWFAARRPGLYNKDNSDEIYTIATDPSSVTTLEGSVRLVSEILEERFPEATLLFVTPIQMSKTDAETIFKVSEIIEKMATLKGYPVVRPDLHTDITHRQEVKSPKFTYDGVHTNSEGASLLGHYILNSIYSLQGNKTQN